jgi:hypothetical protein
LVRRRNKVEEGGDKKGAVQPCVPLLLTWSRWRRMINRGKKPAGLVGWVAR